MKIKSLNIKNFKSIVDITINEPNPFTVFVGPNGSGKSNIFEALEFYISQMPDKERFKLFGGNDSIPNKKNSKEFDMKFSIEFNDLSFFSKEFSQKPLNDVKDFVNRFSSIGEINKDFLKDDKDWIEFTYSFSRIFIKNIDKQKVNYSDDSKINFSASNLEKVLKRLLEDSETKEEISDWLSLFIPEFDRIEVQKSQFSSNEDLLIYQKHYDRPFNKDLISDGTFNIIAILTAVFQSDEPQFLCIEEPENGLNPKVVKELVNLFRDACEQYGHYIWINTHSQTLVSQLKEHELIIVDKIEGETKIKQFKKGAFYGMPADEALLTNALGGGNPW